MSDGGTASDSVVIKRDATPPQATATASPPPGVSGWHQSDVTVHFASTDAESGSGAASCEPDVVLTGEGAGLSVTGTCADVAGNVSASATLIVNIDRTVPTVYIVAPNGGSYPVGTAVSANYSCADALAGIAQCSGPVPSGSRLDTATVGEKTFSVTGVDRAGNRFTATATYSITAAPVGRRRGGGGEFDPWSLLGLALLGMAAAGRKRTDEVLRASAT
jgi:hypothetical protein